MFRPQFSNPVIFLSPLSRSHKKQQNSVYPSCKSSNKAVTVKSPQTFQLYFSYWTFSKIIFICLFHISGMHYIRKVLICYNILTFTTESKVLMDNLLLCRITSNIVWYFSQYYTSGSELSLKVISGYTGTGSSSMCKTRL